MLIQKAILSALSCCEFKMIKWGMEVVTPQSCDHQYNSNSNGETSGKWSQEENKLFENALAIYDMETPDRWQKVAVMIPGKTVVDVINQYKELVNDVSDIEAGLVPIPGYTGCSFTLEDLENNGKFAVESCGKRGSSTSRPCDHERKKGVPWTEEEHKLFLLGLKKYGKGDWRNISRNYVCSRTPTQVASHAQKYFLRQLSGGKDKRRSSIHDITTVSVNLEDTRPTASSMLQQPSSDSLESMVFNSGPSFGVSSYGTKTEGQGPHDDMHRGSIQGSHFPFFQM